METKKYTTHSSFWGYIVASILWAICLVLNIIMHPSYILLIAFNSLASASFLIVAILCRLAWHAYVEISDEGVKMKGCAKRISGNKKEIVDDIFIPWENIEKINVWDNTPLILKTGEKIKLTQQIEIDGKTLRKAFEHHKSKRQEEFKQLKDDSDQLEITSVISAIDNDNKL